MYTGPSGYKPTPGSTNYQERTDRRSPSPEKNRYVAPGSTHYQETSDRRSPPRYPHLSATILQSQTSTNNQYTRAPGYQSLPNPNPPASNQWHLASGSSNILPNPNPPRSNNTWTAAPGSNPSLPNPNPPANQWHLAPGHNNPNPTGWTVAPGSVPVPMMKPQAPQSNLTVHINTNTTPSTTLTSGRVQPTSGTTITTTYTYTEVKKN